MSDTHIYVPKVKYQQLNAIKQQIDNNEFNKALELIEAYFIARKWWRLNDNTMIFDRDTNLVWYNVSKNKDDYWCDISVKKQLLLNTPLNTPLQWLLPTKHEATYILDNDFPLKSNSGNHFVCGYHLLWLEHIENGMVLLLDSDYPEAFIEYEALLLPVSKHFYNNSFEDTIKKFIYYGFDVSFFNSPQNDVDKKTLNEAWKTLENYFSKKTDSNSDVSISDWHKIDFYSTRLPTIDDLRFTDINQGMWEFYTPRTNIDTDNTNIDSTNNATKHSDVLQLNNPDGIRPRNPEQDIRSAKVAIDFGTSSTVVAIRSHGRDELLRIGLQESDFKRDKISENDFENPTILEFLNIKGVLEAWQSEAYRPLLSWDDVHCSHEARSRLRQNDADPIVVGSVLSRLKQWALREGAQRVRITDSQHGAEFEFEPLQVLNPIKGQPLEISDSYPNIDPIELYAWFLGMTINWRERGIFLDYYLTFPIAYPLDTKKKILASFRRGLQRSLPQSLLYSQEFQNFSVTELASEPAAFAAAALQTLEIIPTEEGVAYSVFDFGGGTTDFDYGIYRLPNDEEFDEGWDDVIEHFGSSGDKFLGGENLIENMAYLVFKDNQSMCREKQISFTKPLDAPTFAGSERLISNSQTALTNTTIMMAKLRPLWEASDNKHNIDPILKLSLLNNDNQQVSCEFDLNDKVLIDFLKDRLTQGLVNFFAAMKSSFETKLNKIPEQIHILMAGNASRSILLQDLVNPLIINEYKEDEDKLSLSDNDLEALHPFLIALGIENWQDLPEFIIHEPMRSDPDAPYKPNTKTGVALGLLRIAPGESLKVVNHDLNNDSNTPFQYYVGTFRRTRGKPAVFGPIIKRGDAYNEWYKLGKVRQGEFRLLYTTQPQALTGMQRGEVGLLEKSIRFAGDNVKGKSVFAKIVDSKTVKLCMAENKEGIKNSIEGKTVVLE